MEHHDALFDPETLTNRATGAGSSPPSCSPLPGDDETAKRLRMMRIRGATTNPGAGRKAHYSDEWYTPAKIPAALGKFDLDPCAGPISAHATLNIRPPADGLAVEWEGRVWLNPPYSSVHEWLERMIEHGDGIALVNARPETKWFQKCLEPADAVFWLRGRIDFIRPGLKATHPPVGSVLVAYGERNALALERCDLPGVAMRVSHSGNEKSPSVGAKEKDHE